MPCQEFEERLVDYDQLTAAEREAVDRHTQGCPDCHSFLSALMQVDTILTAAFSDREVSPDFGTAVVEKMRDQGPLRRPSIIPEMLDVVGWAAMLAIVLGLAMFFVPGLDFSIQLAGTVGMLLVTASLWFAYRCYTALQRC